MHIIQAIVLGIIEGATEFLPVSSTFHLIWASRFLAVPQTEFQKTFEIFIQTGAILAVAGLYFKTLITDWALVKKLFVSFVPTAVVGALLYHAVKNVFFESYFIQLALFILVGFTFVVLEKKWASEHFGRTINDLTYTQAALIGLVQALALFPGVSRAGAVIFGLMFLRIKRQEATKYSFLLALPTLLAASALDLIKSRDILFAQSANFNLLAIGFVVSFVSALVMVRWFVGFVQKHSMAVFGWYRVGLGLWLLLMAIVFQM